MSDEYYYVVGCDKTWKPAKHFDISDKVAQNQLSKMRGLGLIGDNGESTKSNKYKYVYQK